MKVAQPKEIHGIPRRAQLNYRTDAEAAIMNAVREVEADGGAPELTDVVDTLHTAFDKLADYNEKPEPPPPPPAPPPAVTGPLERLEYLEMSHGKMIDDLSAITKRLFAIEEVLNGPPDPNADVGASDAPRKDPPPPGLRRRVMDMWNFLEMEYRQSRWPGEGLDHTLMRWRDMILDIAKPRAFDDHEFEDLPAPRVSLREKIRSRVQATAIGVAEFLGIAWLNRADRELMQEANSLHVGIFR